MKQCTNTCYFLMFALWNRSTQARAVVYTLLAIIVVLALVAIGVYASLNAHSLVLGPNSDPWNG